MHSVSAATQGLQSYGGYASQGLTARPLLLDRPGRQAWPCPAASLLQAHARHCSGPAAEALPYMPQAAVLQQANSYR